jgi:FkbM family methyltransferase
LRAVDATRSLRTAAVRVARRSGREDRLREIWTVFLSREDRRGREEHLRMRLLISALLDSESCCVDVGANVGDVLEWIVAAAPDGRHIAYEPVPVLAADLRSRFPGVTVREAAVAQSPGTEEFTHMIDKASRSGLGARGADGHGRTERLDVPVVSLDSDLPAGFTPTLLKLDVEGTEAQVVEGARETIREHRPLVLFEHGYADSSGVLFDRLDELDMVVFDFDGKGPYDRSSFCTAVDTGPNVNYLARPVERK